MNDGTQDDVERRTSLANERTRLAWWRTGLASFAVAIGIGRLLPALTPELTKWPSTLLGVAFAIYGIAFFAYGSLQAKRVQHQLGVTPDDAAQDRPLALLAGAGIVLGIATIVLIVSQ